MPFLASVSHQPLSWPLVNRWTTLPGIGQSYTVSIYRQMIETHSKDKQVLFVKNVSLNNFHMVEWHATDRVFRQFSCMQPIPDPTQEFKEIHGIEKEDRDHINWVKEHAPYIILWNAWIETRSFRNRVPLFVNTEAVSNLVLEP
ncbi:uncharacterized protein [Gossypium hirsutum]|uniref:Uncharacterized protein n=1 Tax=Gossypium hirsutum TaxID=3635 RepID=A0ABM3BN21_GOSHI|nr:uncharacterized protein LOC121229141 [Gossypium hirsutum]